MAADGVHDRQRVTAGEEPLAIQPEGGKANMLALVRCKSSILNF